MKFLYDISFITKNNLAKGIPVHSLRILRAIPLEERKKIILLIDDEMKEYVKKELLGYTYLTYPHFPRTIQKIYNRLFGRLAYKHIVENGGFDALIVPDEYRYISIQNFKIPKFIFCHDLKGTKEAYNLNKKKMNMRRNLYHDAIKTSALVFAISQYTKSDINRIFPDTDMEKVFVIYNSIEIAKKSIKPNGIGTVFPFILSVNHLDRYKNALTTIKAFALISKEYSGNLIIVSRPTEYWMEECLPFIKQEGLDDRIILLSNLANEELRWLYENADLFVSSSSHEGFGFTPIEAAICGCPVVCTDAEALPETTMGLLNYYSPPTDDGGLASKMASELKTPISKSKRIEISDTFKKRYSPQLQVQMLNKIIDDYFSS